MLVPFVFIFSGNVIFVVRIHRTCRGRMEPGPAHGHTAFLARTNSGSDLSQDCRASMFVPGSAGSKSHVCDKPIRRLATVRDFERLLPFFEVRRSPLFVFSISFWSVNCHSCEAALSTGGRISRDPFAPVSRTRFPSAECRRPKKIEPPQLRRRTVLAHCNTNRSTLS
jgi:hypothetical protein